MAGEAMDRDGLGRNETPNERLDRNWGELLQELRVMQTGTQIMAGFLLILPFQERFSALPPTAVALYLVLMVLAAATTCLLLVPVATHRRLFGLRIKERLVTSAHNVLRLGLWLIASLVVGVTALIFFMVLNAVAALIVFLVFGVAAFVALALYPGRIRRSHRD